MKRIKNYGTGKFDGQPDKWEALMLSHLEYGVRLLAVRDWVPTLTKSGIDYMQRKFRDWVLVRCGDQYHRIGITKGGSMGFLDHPTWRAEVNAYIATAERYRNFQELGGTPPPLPALSRCVQYLTLFNPGSHVWRADLTESMDEYRHERVNVRRDRRGRRMMETPDLLQLPLSERWRYNRDYAQLVSNRRREIRSKASGEPPG